MNTDVTVGRTKIHCEFKLLNDCIELVLPGSYAQYEDERRLQDEVAQLAALIEPVRA